MGAFFAGAAAFFVGIHADHSLRVPHPGPAAWFEAGLTGLLIVVAAVAYFVRGDE